MRTVRTGHTIGARREPPTPPERGAGRLLRLRLGLWLLSAPEAVPGRRLPSVRALAHATGVHRNTVAAVYRDLDRLGLVRCVRGAGTFVGGPRRPIGSCQEIVCPEKELTAALSLELGRPVVTTGGPGAALLWPLDRSPPDAPAWSERPVLPVAPAGPALRALRRVRPGGTVHLTSASPRVGCLVRRAVVALHGESVGLERGPAEAALRGGRAPDLHLIDCVGFERRGTRGGPGGLIPLRLLPDVGRRAG